MHHKCYAKCFLEKVGMIKDGVLQEEFILKKFAYILGYEAAEKFVGTCNAIVNLQDNCESAYEMYKCYQLEANKLSF